MSNIFLVPSLTSCFLLFLFLLCALNGMQFVINPLLKWHHSLFLPFFFCEVDVHPGNWLWFAIQPRQNQAAETFCSLQSWIWRKKLSVTQQNIWNSFQKVSSSKNWSFRCQCNKPPSSFSSRTQLCRFSWSVSPCKTDSCNKPWRTTSCANSSSTTRVPGNNQLRMELLVSVNVSTTRCVISLCCFLFRVTLKLGTCYFKSSPLMWGTWRLEISRAKERDFKILFRSPSRVLFCNFQEQTCIACFLLQALRTWWETHWNSSCAQPVPSHQPCRPNQPKPKRPGP